jgi:hypothetical protein
MMREPNVMMVALMLFVEEKLVVCVVLAVGF